MVKSHPENTVGVWGPSRACEEGHALTLHYCMLSPPASFRGLGPPPYVAHNGTRVLPP